MKRLLITGGAGFIGCNFVYYWMKNHPHDKVIVLDSLTYAGKKENLDALSDKENFHFVQGSINDLALIEKLMVDYGIDTIVHFAAESHVDRSISGPDIFIETNINGTHTLLKAAKNCWLDADNSPADCRFHHVSTDEVYGSLSDTDPAFSETTPYAPNSPYSASKASSDHLVRAYHHTYGLPVTISNCSNNYGPYQFPEKLIPLCLQNALNGKSLPIYGDGKNIRDWLYVEDHCYGIDLVLNKGRNGEVYNIGGNNEQANIDVVNIICQRIDALFVAQPELAVRYPNCPAASGKKTETLITFVKDRLGHDRRYAIDARKITNELGYQPQQIFSSGLDLTIHWAMNQHSHAESHLHSA